ncbi:MAG: CHRD domain-containing protein [Croceitalea sp.]|nr:CHRD domain-containing protein [Croceitalea sp.]
MVISSCSSDDNGGTMEPMETGETGNVKAYQLGSVSDPGISGTATFTELDDNTVSLEINLQNTSDGEMHPAHIHFNTAAEGGDIAVSLEAVDGDSGMSTTIISQLNDGTPITYDGLLNFDGYINVHFSADDLGTLIAQGDIGQNELTGMTKVYALGSVSDPDISGIATFEERVNGEALATVDLQNTSAGEMHPGHIHFNTAAEGGDIAVSLIPVNGATGMSKTNINAQDDGTSLGYSALLNFDGYINIHFSADDLGTLIAQGDIGQNELTGMSKVYELGSVSDPDISGTATFEERINGEALATIALENTPAGGSHPGHIHFNTAAEGGGIAFTFVNVNGDTGISLTNVAMLDDETAFGYADILDFDGYINIHLSAENLATLIAQGDIGQNELTGMSTAYPLGEVDVPGISGTATFFERINGEALAEVQLLNTTAGGLHPGHIHMNDAATGGPIAFTLASVVGATGNSKTNVAVLDDGTAFGYEQVLTYDGYINIHLSAENLGTLIAQGNIGANFDADGNSSKNYDVTNNGATSYVFNGEGQTDAQNPSLTLVRGTTYTFTIDASGHPFLIKSVQGNTNANAYNNGVTNNGAENGTVTFTVPMDAPDTLYYNCQFHSSMTGTFTITD